jgi:hypothetical protein
MICPAWKSAVGVAEVSAGADGSLPAQAAEPNMAATIKDAIVMQVSDRDILPSSRLAFFLTQVCCLGKPTNLDRWPLGRYAASRVIAAEQRLAVSMPS